ncbi:hypothetical protein HY948_02680 [Candidatus Gottesmanbacteria bacterium]|nr:hypothetical protein [Candidatus Gottesmanbacteria bacterium]
MRYAFIKSLLHEAEKNDRIMLLTGDLGFTVFEEFRERYPRQFLNVGVAEQNLMGIATGLALSGKIVFAYSIATFATMRPLEQIRLDIASHNAPIIIVGTGAGFSYGHASISHHAMEDIALMRVIPGMTVICPADPTEASWATRQAIKINRPVYLRLGMKGEPNLYESHTKLTIGKGSILRKGKGVALIATGNIVGNTLQAATLLAHEHINPTVVSMHTIKPLDATLITSIIDTHKTIITIEEHSVIGGLGSAVAEIIAEQQSSPKFRRLGIPDRFMSKIGSQQYLRDLVGLSPKKIAAAVKKLI